MRFKVGPGVYRVKVCAGELRVDGKPAKATTLHREIHLSGELHPSERSEILYDQLRRIWESHYGAMAVKGIAAFTAEYSRLLNSQGGEAALMRLDSDGMIDAGANLDMGAEPVGCQCGTCGTSYGAHQIRTGAPETDPSTSRLIVRREVDCDFCGHTMLWLEGATQAGSPNGRVFSGPTYRKGAAV